MKHLKSFNESSREKHHLMSNQQRKNIVREAKKRIKEEVKDYDNKPVGLREGILDEYIEIVCKEKGYTFHNFYGTDGKTLSKILGWD